MEQENFNSKARNIKRYKVLLVTQSLIFILSFWIFVNFYRSITKKHTSPNVDIFQIKCTEICECEGLFNTEDMIINGENKIIWENRKELNLFSHNDNTLKTKIAPFSSGTYNFKIKNTGNKRIKYNLYFEEKNLSQIDMRFNLKRNNQDLYSLNWVKLDKIKEENILNEKKEDKYTLSWKWFESENDTNIGIVGGNYQLTIILSVWDEL